MQLAPMPPIPKYDQTPILQQSNAQKAQAPEPKFMPPYFAPFGHSSAHTFAMLSGATAPTVHGKPHSLAQISGGAMSFGSPVGAFGSKAPWTKNMITWLKKKSTLVIFLCRVIFGDRQC
jgi:hypothetical protein